jgi:hypothetical protein
MLIRTQLSMDREMLRKARTRSSQLGISLAEYVRRLVDEDLGERPATIDPAVVFNLGDSGGSALGKNEDRMIAESFSKGSL